MKVKEPRSEKCHVNQETSTGSKCLAVKVLDSSERAIGPIAAAEFDLGTESYEVDRQNWTTYSKRQHIHCLGQGCVALLLQCANCIWLGIVFLRIMLKQIVYLHPCYRRESVLELEFELRGMISQLCSRAQSDLESQELQYLFEGQCELECATGQNRTNAMEGSTICRHQMESKLHRLFRLGNLLQMHKQHKDQTR